jgi:hypothetical protein
MQTAFDEAWAMQHVGGEDVTAMREQVARAIIDIVGERDPTKIKSYALGELLKYRNLPHQPS